MMAELKAQKDKSKQKLLLDATVKLLRTHGGNTRNGRIRIEQA